MIVPKFSVRDYCQERP